MRTKTQIGKMRIIAGTLKGRYLHAPVSNQLRPTSNRVKEALFNILANILPDIPVSMDDTVFYDFFAGTGSVGIEALSRGARAAVFIEKDRAASTSLGENINKLLLSGKSAVYNENTTSFLNRIGRGQHGMATDCIDGDKTIVKIIFIDPPYRADLVEPVLKQMDNIGFLKDSIVAIEHFFTFKPTVPASLSPCGAGSYRYGDTMLSIYCTNQEKGGI